MAGIYSTAVFRINQTWFPNAVDWYWSSSPYAYAFSSYQNAWVVRFWHGYGDHDAMSNHNPVRLVRGGQPGGQPPSKPLEIEILDPLCSTQTNCEADTFIQPTQQNGPVRLFTDPEKLMQAAVQRDGAVADGVTRLLLRVPSDNPVTFTLKPEDGSTPVEQDSCLWGSLENLDGLIGPSCKSITVNPVDVPNVGKVVFAVFQAPDSVPQPSHPPQATRNVTVETTSGALLATSKTLILQAPPVILIHGVWSSPDA